MWHRYQAFWTAARYSAAFKEYSTRLCGAYFGHDGFSDVSQINLLIDECKLTATDSVLDAGCGPGLIAEYISDKTGSKITGVDYVPAAIDWAAERTRPKADRLKFECCDQKVLPFPENTFDVIYSIDSFLGEQDECNQTVAEFLRVLKPGGRLAFFWGGILFSPKDPREDLLPENLTVGRALAHFKLNHRTINLSEANYAFMQRKRVIADELKSLFESENNLILHNKIRTESADPTMLYNPDTCFVSRYLYIGKIS